MKTLCVDLGGSRVKLALMTAGSHPQPDVFEVDSRAPLAQTLLLVAQHAAAWGQPDAVSIALPCVVCRGTVIACNGKYTDAVGFDWVRWSQKTFGAPVFLMNDAAAALLGEMRCGAAKDTEAAAILMIGTGIGSAAAQDRRILTGRHGTMGMLGGHMAIEMLHPRRCTCGATGCLEAWAGTWALDEIARQEDGFAESALANARKVDYRALLDGVAQGDAVSLRVFETVAMALDERAVRMDDPSLRKSQGTALFFGTEGTGLTRPVLDGVDRTVIIPMARGVDSLNVAASSAVAFWELFACRRG